jgi:RNA 3'-terminal phosphate cyclase-like protein
MCPFAKLPTVITLTGITNNNEDLSVDTIRTVTLPFLSRFGFEDATIQMKVVRRGAPPKGGGEVQLVFEPVRRLTPLMLTDVGRISRVRGIAYAARVSPQVSPRCVEFAEKRVCTQCILTVCWCMLSVC